MALTGVVEEVNRQLEVLGKRSIIKHPILVDDDLHVLGLIDLSRYMLAQAWHWDRIAVVGLGYVGATLAVSLAEVGFHVVGWDANPSVRASLQKGVPHVYERGLESLLRTQLRDDTRLVIADSASQINDCHVYIIAVPTPVNDNGKPDLTMLQKAVEPASRHPTIRRSCDTALDRSSGDLPRASEPDDRSVRVASSGVGYRRRVRSGAHHRRAGGWKSWERCHRSSADSTVGRSKPPAVYSIV